MSPSPCSAAVICLLKEDFAKAGCTHLTGQAAAVPTLQSHMPCWNRKGAATPTAELWTSSSSAPVLGTSCHCCRPISTMKLGENIVYHWIHLCHIHSLASRWEPG